MTENDSRDHDRPDPPDDPFACSKCGCYLGELKRVRGDEYCDACQEELTPGSRWTRCYICGQELSTERADSMDIAGPDAYYPEIVDVCPTHETGGDPA